MENHNNQTFIEKAEVISCKKNNQKKPQFNPGLLIWRQKLLQTTAWTYEQDRNKAVGKQMNFCLQIT